MAFLRADIEQAWLNRDPLTAAFDLQGEMFRDVPGRRTLRVEIAGKVYFVKLHYGVGWPEIIKNWLLFKRPVIGAENEYHACRGLAEVGIPAPVPAAFALGPGSMAARRSFVLCDALDGYTSLEDVTDPWPATPPSPIMRHRALYAVARFAKRFHGQGFIHRDFYICHLLADDTALSQGRVELAVLDLHRARRFAKIPQRWLKRDLAALLFSSLDLGYSQRDWLRFVRLYTGLPLKQALAEQAPLWSAVIRRAEKLYDEGLRKGTVKGMYRQ